MIDFILAGIGVLALLIGSLTDIKTREVPDTISYGLIGLGLALRVGLAIFSGDWNSFGVSILWFLIFVGIAFFMFYSGQWGGADAKLLMGLGIVFSHYPQSLLKYVNPDLNIYFPLSLFINILVIGAIYGLIISLILALKNWKKFTLEYKKIKKNYSKFYRYTILVSLTFLILGILSIFLNILISILLFFISIVSFSFIYLMIFAKAVEESCMVKLMKTSDLTEGEWVVKDIYHEKEYICGPKDLGIDQKQIDLLKKYKIKEILIKQGIPFVPAFLIALIISLIFGNLIIPL
jgi:hypothetical protein